MNRRDVLKNLGVFSAGFGFIPTAKAAENRPILRVAHITDVHVQAHIGAAKGFERCLHHIQNLKHVPDFIFNGGDAIMGAKHSSLNQLQNQFELFNHILKSENSIKVHHCVGNHDLYMGENFDFNGEKQRAMDTLGMAVPYYHFKKDHWNFVVLDSIQKNLEAKKNYTAQIDPAQMDWLKNLLNKIPTDQPVCILTHVPILAACVFFDGKNYKDHQWQVSGSWMHSDADDLIELFNKHPNVKLALSGHIHLQDKVEYNGVSYCCNGAVSGAWWLGKYRQTAPGYALVDLYENGETKVQ